MSVNQVVLKRPNYPDNCKTLDISENVRKVGIRELVFEFQYPKSVAKKTRLPLAIEIKVEDRLNTLARANKFAKLSYSGPSITMENILVPEKKKYLIEFKQTVFVQNDPTKRCTNYPNQFRTQT